jgi:hypothetical protein
VQRIGRRRLEVVLRIEGRRGPVKGMRQQCAHANVVGDLQCAKNGVPQEVPSKPLPLLRLVHHKACQEQDWNRLGHGLRHP